MAAAPSTPATSAASAAGAARAPDMVLLDTRVYIADRPNGTTARGISIAGHAVEVSFLLADPPKLSRLCVHFPGRDNATAGPVEPAVLCSEKDMAIVELHFRYEGRSEYFLYRAHPNHPSLENMYMRLRENHELGLLPAAAAAGDGGYRVAFLHLEPPAPYAPEELNYHLHVLSSETRAWSVEQSWPSPWSSRPRAEAAPPPWSRRSIAGGETLAADPPHETHKVVALGGSALGFVDFRRGILCVNMLDDDDAPAPSEPRRRRIRFPPPVGGNGCLMERRSSSIRDVACVDGVIRFVEVENRRRMEVVRGKKRSFPDVLHDSDLENLSTSSSSSGTRSAAGVREDDAAVDHFTWAKDGWRIVTWSRHLDNSDHWVKDCDACVDDFVIDDPRLLRRLPPELRTTTTGGPGGSEATTTLNKDHVAVAPALSVHDGDVVYLTCKLELTDKAGWLLAINTRKKRVEGVAPITSTRLASSSPSCFYLPCAISKHMSMVRLPHDCKESGCKDIKEEKESVSVAAENGVRYDPWGSERSTTEPAVPVLYPWERRHSTTSSNSARLATPKYFNSPSPYFMAAPS